MNYKAILRNQNLRFRILQLLSFVPDKLMLTMQYYIQLNRKPNLNKPERFTEWLQWYKINYRNPLLFKCVDKFEVRNYIEEKGLSDILIPNIGIYNNVNDIDFEKLPSQFVAKTTDGGGGQNIIICKDKSYLNIEQTKAKLNSWLDKKDINAGREWAYTGIVNSRITIDQFIDNPDDSDAGIEDYKILCFGGKPEYIFYDCDRYIEHKRNTYDTNWNRIIVDTDCKQKDVDSPRPEKLDKMLEIASLLSSDFPFVRVDLYNVKGKIYFGELTFYPWSGYIQFNPDSFDFKLGKLFSEAIHSSKYLEVSDKKSR